MKFFNLIVIFFLMLCNVSAYTPHENGGSRVTASGAETTEGVTIASDHLPFGTTVVILGKSYVVQDRFGGGYSDRIDIFMEDYDQAIQFGRQWIEVEVVE